MNTIFIIISTIFLAAIFIAPIVSIYLTYRAENNPLSNYLNKTGRYIQ